MTYFPTLLYTLTSDIPTLSYTRSLKKLTPSGGTSLYKPLYGVPQGGFTYYWPFIEIFPPAKLSRVLESCISILFSLAFYFRYSIVPAQEKCSICSYPLLTRGFYVFPCHHAFHCDCLKNEVRLLRLFLGLFLKVYIYNLFFKKWCV